MLTRLECKHGSVLKDAKAEPYVCCCCGQEHRSKGQLCLRCR